MVGTLRITQSGAHQTVHLDGVDITHAFRGVKVTVGVGHLPVAELDVLLFEFDTVTEGTTVHLPEATRTALLALGWTPPEEG